MAGFSLFLHYYFLFRYDIGQRGLIPRSFCLLLLFFGLKNRIFFNKKLDVIDYVGGVLVLLFQLLVVRLHLHWGPRPDHLRDLLEDMISPSGSLTFHEMCIFLEVIEVNGLLRDGPWAFSWLSRFDLQGFTLSWWIWSLGLAFFHLFVIFA